MSLVAMLMVIERKKKIEIDYSTSELPEDLYCDLVRYIGFSFRYSLFLSEDLSKDILKGRTKIYLVSNTRQTELSCEEGILQTENISGKEIDDYASFINRVLQKPTTLGIVPIEKKPYLHLREVLEFGNPDFKARTHGVFSNYIPSIYRANRK